MDPLSRDDAERVEVRLPGGQLVEASVEARAGVFFCEVQDEDVGVGGGEGRDVFRAEARNKGAQGAVDEGCDSACWSVIQVFFLPTDGRCKLTHLPVLVRGSARMSWPSGKVG